MRMMNYCRIQQEAEITTYIHTFNINIFEDNKKSKWWLKRHFLLMGNILFFFFFIDEEDRNINVKSLV